MSSPGGDPAALALAVILGTSFLGSGAVFVAAVMQRFFARSHGSVAVVIAALIGICWALVLGQVLGAGGWLSRGPLVLTAVASAAAATFAGHRYRPGEPAVPDEVVEPEPAGREHPALLVTTVLLVLLVAAVWTARTVITVRRGINDPDSLGYHLPFAATFAQTRHADQTRFIFPFLPIQFYPANDELLGALALILTRSVVFVAVKNLLYGGLVLVAAHAVGKAFGTARLAVGAAAVVLGLPVIAFSQPGEGVNDSLVLFALLGGMAVLASARDRPAPYILALSCAGVAYGAKFSAVVPGVALAVAALWLLRARLPTARLRTAVTGALLSFATGGSWYVRNALAYGSPVPPAHLALGPIELPQIATDAGQYSFSIAWYLARGMALGVFRRGLGQGIGPLFVIVLGAWLCGAVAALFSRDRSRRVLGAVALVTALGYLTLPASAYGRKGTPDAFVINLHYAGPALIVGLVAGAVVVGRRRWTWVLPLVGWVVVASSIGPGRRITFWAPEIGGPGFGILVAASLAGGAVAWMWVRPPLGRWVRAGAGASGVLALVGVVLVGSRYPSLATTDPVQRWAADAAPTTIAGWMYGVSTLYAPGVPNRVVTLTHLVDGAPVPLDSCPTWVQALRDGGYPYTVVIPKTKWQRWMEADPAFELAAANEFTAVYRVAGTPDPGCPRAG